MERKEGDPTFNWYSDQEQYRKHLENASETYSKEGKTEIEDDHSGVNWPPLSFTFTREQQYLIADALKMWIKDCKVAFDLDKSDDTAPTSARMALDIWRVFELHWYVQESKGFRESLHQSNSKGISDYIRNILPEC